MAESVPQEPQVYSGQLGLKYRVILPRGVRDALEVAEGDTLLYVVEGKQVRLTTKHLLAQELYGSLAKEDGRDFTQELLDERRAEGEPLSVRPLLIDASALTAFIRREPGGERVLRSLTTARREHLVSTVQLIEVEGKLVSDGTFTPEQVRTRIHQLEQLLTVIPFEGLWQVIEVG